VCILSWKTFIFLTKIINDCIFVKLSKQGFGLCTHPRWHWKWPKLRHPRASSSLRSEKREKWLYEAETCLQLGNKQEQIGRFQGDLLLVYAKPTVVFVQIQDDLVAHQMAQLLCFCREFSCCKHKKLAKFKLKCTIGPAEHPKQDDQFGFLQIRIAHMGDNIGDQILDGVVKNSAIKQSGS